MSDWERDLFRRLAAESRAEAAACRRDHFGTWRVTVRNGNYSAFNGGRFTPSDYSELRCGTCDRRWRTNAGYVARVPDGTSAPPDETPADAERAALSPVQRLVLGVLHDWPGAHSVSNLADRRRLVGEPVAHIRRACSALAVAGLARRPLWTSEYEITDAGRDWMVSGGEVS